MHAFNFNHKKEKLISKSSSCFYTCMSHRQLQENCWVVLQMGTNPCVLFKDTHSVV